MKNPANAFCRIFFHFDVMTKNEITETIFSYLRENGIPYRSYSHPKTDTLPEKLENDRRAGVENALHCKNLVLCNRQKTHFYLLTMGFTKRFSTGPVSRQMASSRLSFAPDSFLEECLMTHSGAVSPLELIFDREKKIAFFADEDLKKADRITFHPADEEITVVLEREDFFSRFLPSLGIEAGFVSIEEME